MNQRKQNSTAHPCTFWLAQSVDHQSPATGLAPTVMLSKDGGNTFGAAAGAVTEMGNGWYALAGNATDRNTLGELTLHATATGADPADKAYVIVPWDPFDGNLALTGLNGLAAPGAAGGLATADASNRVKALDSTGATFTYVTPPTSSAIAAAVMGDVTDTVGADVLAIKTQTDKLGFSGANVLAQAAAYAAGQDPVSLLSAYLVDGAVTLAKLWKILLSFEAGLTSLTDNGNGTHTLSFKDQSSNPLLDVTYNDSTKVRTAIVVH